MLQVIKTVTGLDSSSNTMTRVPISIFSWFIQSLRQNIGTTFLPLTDLPQCKRVYGLELH